MRQVSVEVVAYTPTEFFHCLHCEVIWREAGIGRTIHAEQRASALPPHLAQEYAEIGAWLRDLTERYRGHLSVNVVDAVSLEGFYKVLRHRLGKLPAIIVDGQPFSSDQLDAAIEAIDARAGNAGAPTRRSAPVAGTEPGEPVASGAPIPVGANREGGAP